MGGVQNFASDPLGAGVNLLTFGSFGSGGYLTDAGFEKKKDKDYAPQQQQTTQQTTTTAPDAPKADVNASLLAQQGDRRKRFLLQQSTGRPPQGPSLTQPNQRTLF